jgi:ABC-type nitrate/sulfonate/bicarbonate transport system substrate-binding protein
MAINILWLGAAGLGSILLSVAHRQRLFQKHGVDVRLVPVLGTQVPELTTDIPFGYIGAPAAVMRAAEGVDLKILASFDTARLSSCLVVRPGINEPEQLRGTRLGARVTGAAMWIHTVLALEKLGLHPEQDQISIAEIGDPADVVRALEAGQIDGAVLARAQCEQLATKGYTILLDLFPLEMFGAPDALVVTTGFLREHPDAVDGIIAGLIEGTAFALSLDKRPEVLDAIKSGLNITDEAAAVSGLKELSNVVARKPYASIDRLCEMQRLMLTAKPQVQDVSIDDLVDDTFVRKLDESGFINRIYAEYGIA